MLIEEKNSNIKPFFIYSVQIQYSMDFYRRIFDHHLLIYFVVDIQNVNFLEEMKV